MNGSKGGLLLLYVVILQHKGLKCTLRVFHLHALF